MNMKQSKAA